MYDFQHVRAAYLTANGITDEPEDIETADDLDNLYAGLAEHMREEPEQWQ